MSHVPMIFQFKDRHAASLAHDTLTEIGYHVHMADRGDQPVVQVFVDHSELTSALEIAQAHGGDLLPAEEQTYASAADVDTSGEGQLYNMAYGMDMVPIPAHLVNEDAGADAPLSSDFDPSGDDYDGFDAGVHM